LNLNPQTKLDFKIKSEYKRTARILPVGIEYSMCDLICDNWLWEKLSVYDQIIIKYCNGVLHEFPPKNIQEWNTKFNKTKCCKRKLLNHLH